MQVIASLEHSICSLRIPGIWTYREGARHAWNGRRVERDEKGTGRGVKSGESIGIFGLTVGVGGV